MARLEASAELRKIIQRWAKLAAKKTDGVSNLWGDSSNERNSVMDAEALIIPFSAYRNAGEEFDLNADEILTALLGALLDLDGGQRGVRPTRNALLDLTSTFFDTYGSRGRNLPDFTAPSYLDPVVSDEISEMEYKKAEDEIRTQGKDMVLVDSLTFSVSLCLYVLAFLQRRRNALVSNAQDVSADFDERYKKVSERLTYALRGLCASFVVYSVDQGDWENRTRRKWPGDRRFAQLWDRLRSMGVSQKDKADVFECGWSWGPVSPTKLVGCGDNEYSQNIRHFSEAVKVPADAAPYLYSTIIALDGLEDLFATDVNALDILNGEQLYLANRLRIMTDITRKYWTEIISAPIDSKQPDWAIEQMPFYPSDAENGDTASAYWNLYLVRLIMGQSDFNWEISNQQRFIRVLEDIAKEGRITRQEHPKGKDENLRIYQTSGWNLRLVPDDEKTYKDAFLKIYDYAPQLLKACGQLIRVVRDSQLRTRINAIIDSVWNRVLLPSFDNQSLWVNWSKVYDWYEAKDDEAIGCARSWYYTERVVEGLIAVASGTATKPQSNNQLRGLVQDVIADIEYELSGKDISDEVRKMLDDARHNAERLPGVAFAQAIQALQSSKVREQ